MQGPSLAKRVANVDIAWLNDKRERLQIFAEEPQMNRPVE
jgi:hypothetical protein